MTLDDWEWQQKSIDTLVGQVDLTLAVRNAITAAYNRGWADGRKRLIDASEAILAVNDKRVDTNEDAS